MTAPIENKVGTVDLPQYVIRIMKILRQKIDAYDLSSNKNLMLKIPIQTTEPYCYEGMKLIEKTLSSLGYSMNYSFGKATAGKHQVECYRITFSVKNKN